MCIPPAKGDFAICSRVFVDSSGHLVPMALWPFFRFGKVRLNHLQVQWKLKILSRHRDVYLEPFSRQQVRTGTANQREGQEAFSQVQHVVYL